MAIVFSKIILRADELEAKFFACGTIRELGDLDPYTLYHEFTEEISSETDINVHVDTHIYGEGERFDATPEEMAYFTIRDRDDPTFLSRCEKIGESDFCFTYCPEELFGQNF